jgi:secondary thiamine-phosphate synthase enzyme
MNFSIKTKGHNDIIDITDKIQGMVSKSEVKSGLCLVFVAHSTCGITTIEYEDGLIQDLKEVLEKLIPSDKEYHHDKKWRDANGYAHLRSAIIGTSFVAPLEEGKLKLGTWQQIILIDFDNKPRTRDIELRVISEK